MPIQVSCPGCGNYSAFPDHFAGGAGQCPRCGQMISVPGMPGYAAPPQGGGGGGVGKVLAIIGVVLLVILLICGGGAGALYYWIYTSVQSVAQVSRNNHQLSMLGIAMHNFHDSKDKLPAHTSIGPDNKPLLSWRVHLLPYLEAGYLYDQFHLDEPWDSPHNRSLIPQMPFAYQMHGMELEAGKTCFVVPVGQGTLFPKDGLLGVVDKTGVGTLGFSNVNDGLTNTIMVLVVPANQAVIWTQPDDFDLDTGNLESLFDAGKPLQVLSADGTTHQLKSTVDRTTLRNLMLIDDGSLASLYDVDSLP